MFLNITRAISFIITGMKRRIFLEKSLYGTGLILGVSVITTSVVSEPLNPYPCDNSVLLRLNKGAYETFNKDLLDESSDLSLRLRTTLKQSRLFAVELKPIHKDLYKLVLNQKIDRSRFATFMHTFYESNS